MPLDDTDDALASPGGMRVVKLEPTPCADTTFVLMQTCLTTLCSQFSNLYL